MAQANAAMPPLTAQGPDAIHRGVLQQEHRNRVAAAKGSQAAEFLYGRHRQFRNIGHGIQLERQRLGYRVFFSGPIVDGFAPIFSSSMVRPAAAECPPKRSSSGAQAHKAACRLKLVGARPLPRPSPFSVEITMEGRPYFSIRRVATMPITPGCQPSPDTTITRSRTRAGSALSFSSAAAAICCSAC